MAQEMDYECPGNKITQEHYLVVTGTIRDNPAGLKLYMCDYCGQEIVAKSLDEISVRHQR